ncbi:hypothetical protein TrRE_jg12107 [Triparma retinervis]|uniref:Trafficking protein particle complex subunit n=1 Tax=Triparma retinervis TaxID=2557542 RepID=A0A9W7A9N3_9STRA|nr:hypothetical protein TrRE_jg12107 [Triparma retinervis]
MTFLHLFIVNKSGGLIYSTSFSPSSPPLNTNDSLRIGSTFHSLHAIASQASPPPSSSSQNYPPESLSSSSSDGIETIEAGPLTLRCLQTPTGLKFILTASSSSQTSMKEALMEIYAVYADFAMKNPFYELEMPVRGDKFDRGVRQAVMGKEGKGGYLR